jgi:hypothetical protein
VIKARAIGLFVVAPTLVLAASIFGALAAAGAASRVVSIVLAVAAAVLLVWGATYVRRLPTKR